MVNLETAVTDRGSAAAKAFTFRAPTSAFSALAAGGVDVVNVANNHGMDSGPTGLRDTLSAGKRAGMPIVGRGMERHASVAPHRVKVDGQRIAIIGATQVLDDHLVTEWTAGPGRSARRRRTSRASSARCARPGDERYRRRLPPLGASSSATCPTGARTSLARALVGAGADVVVGSHAHVLQGAGRMNRALVAYGLGNFVFFAFREPRRRPACRGDRHRAPDRRVPVGAGSHLRRHPAPVDGRRTVAGVRELAGAPRGAPASDPDAGRRDAAARTPARVAYRSRTGPVLPSPRATRSRSLCRARRRLLAGATATDARGRFP